MDKELEKFTMPLCKICRIPAEIEKTDNGACGDPECCGTVIEYYVLSCPECKTIEILR
jgi:hypothetical protein